MKPEQIVKILNSYTDEETERIYPKWYLNLASEISQKQEEDNRQLLIDFRVWLYKNYTKKTEHPYSQFLDLTAPEALTNSIFDQFLKEHEK
jgi:hypothetical protein